jgi:hypothetical protein
MFTIRKERNKPKINLVRGLIDELDSLYDDLNYYKDDLKEIESIKKKIEIREMTINLLLYKERKSI